MTSENMLTHWRYVNQYLTDGHRFIHNNIVIRIYRIKLVPEGTGALEPLDAPLPAPEELKLLDQSGTWMMEVFIRIADGTNSKLLGEATKELLALQREVEGAIDLRVPERLSLDTRVPGS